MTEVARKLVAVQCVACEAQSLFVRDPDAGGVSDLVEKHECASCGAELTVTLALESGRALGYDVVTFAEEAVNTAYREGLEKPASAKRVLSISGVLAALYVTADVALTDFTPIRAGVAAAFGFVVSLFCIGAVLTMSQSGFLSRLLAVVRRELSSDPAVCPECETPTFRRGLAGEFSCASCDKNLVVSPLLLARGEGAVLAKEAFESTAAEVAKVDSRLRLEPSRRDWIVGTLVTAVVLMIVAAPDWFGL